MRERTPNPAMARQTDPKSPGRRAVLKRLGTSLGAVAAGALAIGSAGCAPLIDPEAVSEIPLTEVPEGRKMIVHADRRVELSRNGDTVIARLMTCTHEYCDLTWDGDRNNYRCTCHGGTFYADGRAQSGPVSKPMFVIPTRIEGETLIIGPAGELQLSG